MHNSPDFEPDRLAGSLQRSLAILRFLGDNDEESVSIADLIASQDVHRTTIVRMLHTLESAGFVSRLAGGRWALGPTFIELGARALGKFSLRDHAKRVMQRLAEATNESIQLCIRSGDDMFVVDVVESSHAVRVGLPLGHRAPLYCTATGKAILAFLSEAEIDDYLGRTAFAPLTSRTIVDRDAFRRELADVRIDGYSTNDEEHCEGVRFVGAPVLDAVQRPIAALVLGGPSIRFSTTDFPRHGAMVRKAADEIGQTVRLGIAADHRGSRRSEVTTGRVNDGR